MPFPARSTKESTGGGKAAEKKWSSGQAMSLTNRPLSKGPLFALSTDLYLRSMPYPSTSTSMPVVGEADRPCSSHSESVAFFVPNFR